MRVQSHSSVAAKTDIVSSFSTLSPQAVNLLSKRRCTDNRELPAWTPISLLEKHIKAMTDHPFLSR